MKRMRTIWGAAWLLLGACLLLAPGAARAQGGDQAPELARDWNLRVGLFIPQSQTTRGKSGEVGFSGIVERRVYRAQMYDLFVGIGYNGWDPVYSIPIMVNIIAHHNSIRYGIGAGYSFGKRDDGRGTDGAVLGLILGYELTHGRHALSADLRYNFITGSNNELDGYSLTIGMQF